MGNRIKRAAKLLTYTVLHTVPEGFDAPLIIGMVGFPEGEMQLCNGKCEEQDLEMEKKVVVIFEDGKYYFEFNGQG